MWFRIPDPPFQPLGGLGAHLSPFGPRGSSPRIPQSIPLSPCGGFIGSDLRTLVGRTRYGLCLASTCAPIIADQDPLVKGFSEIFSEFFVPQFLRASPAGLGRPTAPTLVGDCYPPCLGGGAQPHHLPTFRAIAACSGGHPIPLESSPFDGLILSRFSGFVKGFLKVFQLDGSSARQLPPLQGRLWGNQLYSGISGSQGLYFATMASPCSATIRGPRRGWGSHPLLT